DSFQEAADFALDADVEGFVSVGGGSSIDTAKVANLIVTHPAPVMDYVNPPIGEGRKPPAPLKPHLAVPTTSGTGSEATTVAVLDIPDKQVESGISHRYLRPDQAIVDPELARTMPAVGFGSAGVHIPHACAYPIAGLKHVYRPPGYPDDHPLVPHGHSVIVTAPAAFRFTYEADPERHHRVAELLTGEPAEGPDAL